MVIKKLHIAPIHVIHIYNLSLNIVSIVVRNNRTGINTFHFIIAGTRGIGMSFKPLLNTHFAKKILNFNYIAINDV